MTYSGWFKFYRKMYKNSLWLKSTSHAKVVMITLLGMVNFEENEWEWQDEEYKCGPGQVVTSVKSIVKNIGGDITERAVRCALVKLQKQGFITVETSRTGSLITIVNWAKYQAVNTSEPEIENKPESKPKSNKAKNTHTDPGVSSEDERPEEPGWGPEDFISPEAYNEYIEYQKSQRGE